jgi:hypothetical protein
LTSTATETEASVEAGEQVLVSHLKANELVALAMQLRGRTDSEWQRAVNLHGALIAVMIFFANQAEPFLAARVMVYVFYTYNVVMLLRGLTEAYAGLREVTSDLLLLPAPERGGQSLRWLTARRFRREAPIQCSLLVAVWALIGYLLIGSLLLGRSPLHP